MCVSLLVWIVSSIDQVAHDKSYAIKLTQISYTSMTCYTCMVRVYNIN